MDVVDLRPDLRMLRGTPGQAYLFRWSGGVVLVDTGAVGAGGAVAAALRDWGADRDALTHVLLTHWHPDHAGSAAEIGAWPGVQVWAHRDDAPVVRGERAGAAPVLTEAEAALHAVVAGDLPDAPPARVDRELTEEVLDELGLEVLGTPGHTDGSIALFARDEGVLFTGDIAAEHEGAVILGPFNVDRDRAAASFRRLGERAGEADTICFGHGAPLDGAAARALRDAARAPAVPDPLG
jgi:glyoxylase-like metal-dependent hydrolase (beta-lactamase superfamily II)